MDRYVPGGGGSFGQRADKIQWGELFRISSVDGLVAGEFEERPSPAPRAPEPMRRRILPLPRYSEFNSGKIASLAQGPHFPSNIFQANNCAYHHVGVAF
jgi:hypothetical protein